MREGVREREREREGGGGGCSWRVYVCLYDMQRYCTKVLIHNRLSPH